MLIEELETEPALSAIPAAAACTMVLRSLQNPAFWAFLQSHSSDRAAAPSLCTIETEFCTVELQTQPTSLERPFSSESIFLHAFSGRRRQGDLQFYMEVIYPEGAPPGTTLHVVSLDVVIDPLWGNVRDPATQSFWLDGVRQRWVVGALMGPPCETWSQARYNKLPGQHRRGPRPLRDLSHLWGLESLSLREAAQVDVGNDCSFRST